jgi:hypothetical protein
METLPLVLKTRVHKRLLSMSFPFATWVAAEAIDIRGILHRFTLRTAILARLCLATARRMRAFFGFFKSHEFLPDSEYALRNDVRFLKIEI